MRRAHAFAHRIRGRSDGSVLNDVVSARGGPGRRSVRLQADPGSQGGRVKDLHKWLAVTVFAVACAACGGTENASSTEAEEPDAAAAEEAKAPRKAVPVYREVTVPAGT